MEQPAASQREVGNAQFGNNTSISQDNNTITQHINFNLPLRPARAAIRIIPYPLNEDLVDRPDLIKKLNKLLPPTSQKYCSAALWGLGGSGKTQIALNYAYERCNNTNCSVFWVHADSEATFSQDYKTIARAFGINEHIKSEDLFAAVCDQIAAQPDWVLILDNADDLGLFGVNQTSGQVKNLQKYIPHASMGTVLWTSRDAHIKGTLVGARRSIEVARMESDEAAELLTIARDLETNEGEAETAPLLEELQWLPLAITQAGAYMRRTSTSAKEYSSLLAQSKRRWEILKENEFDRHRRLDVPNNVLETWSISIDRLREESKIAYTILHVLAYVANQNIPHEIIIAALKHGDNTMVQPEKLEAEAMKAIMRLKEFSFLGIHQMEDGSRNYEMHKLVQEATRYGLSVWKPSVLERGLPKMDGEIYFSSTALQVIGDLFPESQPETWKQCETYLAHALQAGDWADLSEKQIETSRLLVRISRFLHDRGRWREKEPVNERALELNRKIQGDRHPDTIRAMEDLASTYNNQGRYSKAEAIQVQVLDLQREVLGDRHADTIIAMGNLASIYHSQGRYSEAEAIDIQVLDLRREILGDRHLTTTIAMGNLALCYYSQGRYSKAEAIQVQVLDLQREVLGDRHPTTLIAMGNLTLTYHRQGQYSKAEAIDIQVLDLRREILGDRHPTTLIAMGNLTLTYHRQGQYSKAEAIQVQVLNLRREILGDRHPDTIIAMGNVASIYHSQGQYSKAEAIQVQVLNLRREILGKEHPNTLAAMHTLAHTWYKQSRLQDAIALMQECAQYRRSVLGPEHPDTVDSAETLQRWKHSGISNVRPPTGQSGDE
ncbi:P-loop containing nucleoside triphosphate hydrolase protein [Trichoderma barbatum]